MFTQNDLKQLISTFDNVDNKPLFCLETLTFQDTSYYATNTRGIIIPNAVINVSNINDPNWEVKEEGLNSLARLTKIEDCFVKFLATYDPEQNFYRPCRTQWDLVNKMRFYFIDIGITQSEVKELYDLMGSLYVSSFYFNVYNDFKAYLMTAGKNNIVRRIDDIIWVGDFKYTLRYNLGKCNEEA